jgi:hypothetical protein
MSNAVADPKDTTQQNVATIIMPFDGNSSRVANVGVLMRRNNLGDRGYSSLVHLTWTDEYSIAASDQKWQEGGGRFYFLNKGNLNGP